MGSSAVIRDENDLARRLCRALDVAARAVRELAPQGYTDPEDPQAHVEGEKVIAETAMLLLASADAAQQFAAVRQRLEAVADLLCPLARSDAMRGGLCLHPALARDYAFGHLCLARLGRPDPEFDRLLGMSLEAEEEAGLERLPYRTLEQFWLARLWSGNRRGARVEAATARASMLGRTLDALTASREDVYALTHALIYLTDLGRRRPRLPRPTRAIMADAEAALARCLDHMDYDLGGEVLLSWPLFGRRWSPVAAFAWRVLARVEDEVGFLPSPATRMDRYRALPSAAERTRYALATAYHTAYVMGLLCATALASRTPQPPVRWDGAPRYDAAAVPAILELLRGDRAEPHWLEDFIRLRSMEQRALAPMLLTVALQRAAASRDFAALRKALMAAVSFRLAAGPAARQAAALLRRAALSWPGQAARTNGVES